MAYTSCINFEYETVYVPTIANSSDVYSCQKLNIEKPKWVEDVKVSACVRCNARFTQLKRRHHCRQCGLIYCSGCCQDKMVLCHMDYSGPERVCQDCQTNVNVFYLSLSDQLTLQLEGSKALKTRCGDRAGVKQLLQIGGVHVLIHMGKIQHDTVRAEVLEALSLLVSYSSLLVYTADLGAMKVVCRILSETGSCDLQLTGMRVLTAFCQNMDLKVKAFDHGALPPLLHMCSSSNEAVALQSVTCLSSITEHVATHDALVESNIGNALACLLSLIINTGEPVQEKLLQIVANISFGTDKNRQKLKQEDLYTGGCFCQLLRSRHLLVKSISHTCCILANVMATSTAPEAHRDHMLALCHLLKEIEPSDPPEFLSHLARAVANGAKFQFNCDILIDAIPAIVEVCMKSADHNTKFHGFRAILSLLKYIPEQTIDVLHMSGAREFLQCLCGTQNTLDTILNASLARVDLIAKPD